MNGKIIGIKIKRARENKGWGQQELAERTGVRQGTIAQYEGGGKVRPDSEIVNKISKALNVSSDYLLAENEPLPHFCNKVRLWLENPECVSYVEDAYKTYKEVHA